MNNTTTIAIIIIVCLLIIIYWKKIVIKILSFYTATAITLHTAKLNAKKEKKPIPTLTPLDHFANHAPACPHWFEPKMARKSPIIRKHPNMGSIGPVTLPSGEILSEDEARKYLDVHYSEDGEWIQNPEVVNLDLWGKYITLPEGFKEYIDNYVAEWDKECKAHQKWSNDYELQRNVQWRYYFASAMEVQSKKQTTQNDWLILLGAFSSLLSTISAKDVIEKYTKKAESHESPIEENEKAESNAKLEPLPDEVTEPENTLSPTDQKPEGIDDKALENQ